MSGVFSSLRIAINQGWGAGKFFSGSGSWFFFQTAPAPKEPKTPGSDRLLFFSSGSGSKEPKTPGSDRLLVFFSSGSGSKEPKTPGSDRLLFFQAAPALSPAPRSQKHPAPTGSDRLRLPSPAINYTLGSGESGNRHRKVRSSLPRPKTR